MQRDEVRDDSRRTGRHWPSGLEGVWAHEVGGGRQLLAVAVHQQYPGHVRQTGLLTASLPSAAYMNKFVVVFDHDVDPAASTT